MNEVWANALVFTTSDNSWGPTDISFLENRFTNKAVKSKRYEVLNRNEPSPGNVTEEKEAELEEFEEIALSIDSLLGFKPFTAIEDEPDFQISEDVFELKQKIKRSGQITDAKMVITDKGYKFLAGSKIELLNNTTISNSIKEMRKNAEKDANGVLLKSYTFNSASTAGRFVVGQAIDGLLRWKCDGVSLGDILKKNEMKK